MKKIIAGAVLALTATASNADFGGEVGVVHNSYSNSGIKNEWGYNAKVGYDNIYGWASYEEPEVFGYETEVIGAGVGAEAGLSDNFAFFIEGGYYWADEDKESPYALDDDFGGTVGISFSPVNHVKVSGGYKFLSLDVKETDVSNKFNGFEIGVSAAF